LVERINKDPGLYTIKLGTLFSFQILEKMKDVNAFTSWIGQLNSLYDIHADACVWLLKYLTKRKDLINAALVESTNVEVREGFKNLLITAISVVSKVEEPHFDEVYNVVDVDEQGNLVNKT